MHVILEIWYAAETGQLGYRYEDKFSAPRSLPRKESETELYGDGYYYRSIAREFGIPESEDIEIRNVRGETLWSG